MNFLGMGPGELLLILVIALIVFGPGRLPEIAAQVGRGIREFKRMSSDITSDLTREMDLDENKDLKQTYSDIATTLNTVRRFSLTDAIMNQAVGPATSPPPAQAQQAAPPPTVAETKAVEPPKDDIEDDILLGEVETEPQA